MQLSENLSKRFRVYKAGPNHFVSLWKPDAQQLNRLRDHAREKANRDVFNTFKVMLESSRA